MSDSRLIERWLPISALGVESTRERTPMTPFPAPNRLHVWWARRPLVASRAAVLGSLLPADADRERFLHVIGIHGDPVASRRRIANANRTGERLGADAYGYSRAFGYSPTDVERGWATGDSSPGALVVLDPTAGGGSIPLEALRLGISAYANDLNPVAALVERATVEWPARYGVRLKEAVEDLGDRRSPKSGNALSARFPRSLDMTSDQMATCGRVRSSVPTAVGLCRSRRTGGWRPTAPVFGLNLVSATTRHPAASARSR